MFGAGAAQRERIARFVAITRQRGLAAQLLLRLAANIYSGLISVLFIVALYLLYESGKGHAASLGAVVVIGEAADGRGVAAPVVVDDDHHRPPRCGDVVQRLPAHAAGQRAVTDHHDDMPPGAGQLERLGQTVRIGQSGGRVAVLDEIVLALRPVRVAGQAVPLP